MKKIELNKIRTMFSVMPFALELNHEVIYYCLYGHWSTLLATRSPESAIVNFVNWSKPETSTQSFLKRNGLLFVGFYLTRLWGNIKKMWHNVVYFQAIHVLQFENQSNKSLPFSKRAIYKQKQMAATHQG